MEVDAEGLPFLRLPHPHTNIIITLPRYSDGEEVLIAFNDPRVYMNLANPPFPYTLPDWEWAFERFSSTSNRALDELIKVEAARQTISTSETEKWVGSAMPMISIREVNSANGEQRFIGNINVRRGDFMTTVDPDERKRLADANQAMEAGDERIEWELGFWLTPSVHGRGIMPAALRTVIQNFLVPYMNVHNLGGAYFDHNNASRRTFEKSGFIFEKSVPEAIEIQESKTGVKGKRFGLGIMRWERTLYLGDIE